jgi:hypothetical protein
MLEYGVVKRNKTRLLALTGLTVKEFEELLPYFQRAYSKKHEGPRLANGEPRQRAVGGGRGGALKASEQKLLFILVYLKTYPVQAVMGELFGMSLTSTNEWIHRLLLVVKTALDQMGVKPQRSGKDFWISESGHGETDYMIDGTDRRRQRPKDVEKQGNHYSGKKKAHSDKNIVVTSKQTKRIGFLGATYPGKTHDKTMAEAAEIRYPGKTILHKDTGFQGYEPEKVETRQPKKSRKGQS